MTVPWRGLFFSFFIVLAVISLLVACTGFGTRVGIKLALVRRDFFHSGDIETALVMVETDITGAGSTELYTKAIKKLKPKKLPQTKDAETALRDQYIINTVTEAAGEVTVDFSSRNLQGTAREEQLLIAQIVATLTGSFSEVESVRFTVDGEPAETLMGHVPIETGFSRLTDVQCRNSRG